MDRTVKNERPPTRRRPLTDATCRANEAATARRPAGMKAIMSDEASSPTNLPHNESLVPNGTLAVRHEPALSPPSPINKRLSAVTDDDLHNPKRDSEISNASSTGSGTRSRRKTHIGPWQLGKTIGKGGCSRVRVVRHSTTGQYGAAKIIAKAMAEKVRALSLANLVKSAEEDPTMFPGGKAIPFGLEREIVIMKLLDHPNIVRLHDVWENRNELYLIMEYVQGGELFHYIAEKGGLDEIEVVHLFRQIIAALCYCHRLNIHHRDLKPENILLDRTTWEIKLVDFGMAALQPEGKQLSTPCGSPHYAAPEVLKFKSYDGGMADVWSCGVILFVMLTGSPPFNYCEDRDLKQLFHAIARADYTIPDYLSPEAQDLIKKILVPKPHQRIRIENIWQHPFLRKYNSQLQFVGRNAALETWIGPRPRIDGWQPLTRDNIDREILRNMRTLWHSEKVEILIQKLLSPEANQEKYFYQALLKHREEHLENYHPNPAAVAYSASDHHHIKDSSTNNLQVATANRHKRNTSGFSILNDEHLYSKHSFYEPPPSDASYDPFRASRDPIIPATEMHMNVTVHRGSVSGSRYLRPVTALGHRSGSSMRMTALRNSRQRGSGLSSNVSKKSSAAQMSLSSAKRRSISRSSLVSSHWPSSPPVIMKPSSAKRNVSFSHLRRSSTASALTMETSGPQYTPEQQRFLNRPESIPSSRTGGQEHQSMRPIKAPSSPKAPRVRIRKPESPSKYIQSEARKVSTELEKVMEEAFNRSSMSSSVRTSITADRSREPLEFDTPPTSFSNRGSGGSGMGVLSTTSTNRSTLEARPLPPLPDISSDTPTTYISRQIAETREAIVRRLATEDPNTTAQYTKILEDLDRLLQHPSNPPTRNSSAPPPRATDYSGLPVISEEGRIGDFDERPKLHGRRANTEHSTTIRLIDPSSPTPIAPLNIRKRSGASTVSSRAGANDASAVPWPGPPTVKPFKGVHEDLLAARDEAAPPPNPPVAASEKDKKTLKKKKSLSWFRRSEKDQDPEPQNQQQTHDTQLRIPQAWQGLDDRIKAEPALTPTKANGTNLVRKDSDQSSEFPIRGRNSGTTKPEGAAHRKGFLGLFGKKQKEDKGKSTEPAPNNRSTDSFETCGFDVGGPDENLARPAELQLNWLARFLHIKPATKNLCFQIARGRARAEMVRLLRDWQRYGVRDIIFDRNTNVINARVDKLNHLKIKPVSLVIELFVVLEHGRRANLCIARFTQTRGAASSFRKVVDIVEDVCRARAFLVEDEVKKTGMLEILA